MSLGFGRIEGPYESFTGVNTWGGLAAETPRTFTGKSTSIICIDGNLYAWRSDRSKTGAFKWKQLVRSTDKGASWEESAFPGSYLGGCVGCPGLPYTINYGKNYGANTDGYVYTYTIRISNTRSWEVQAPGEVWLARGPAAAEAWADVSNWEWVTELGAGGVPRWGALDDRIPVLSDPDGFMRGSALYVPGLDRYLMVTNHTVRNKGNLAIWEAPKPWGPFRRVLHEKRWPEGDPGAPRRGELGRSFAFGSFSPKWLSADGRSCVFVWFRPDAWNSVACTLEVAQ